MRAIMVFRVSTEDQNDSEKAQLDACLGWAAKNNAEPVGPFVDHGVCGAANLDKREGMLAGIGELRKGDVLLVAKRDRIGRDPFVIAMVEAAVRRKGCRLVSVAGEGTDDDSPTSILMRRIVDAFGEYERLIIKSRTKAVLQAKIRRDERIGNVRYGYDAVPDPRPRLGKRVTQNPMRLIPNETEQAVIQQIIAWRSEGQSYRQIADQLTTTGVPTKDGKPGWIHTTVARILKRPELQMVG